MKTATQICHEKIDAICAQYGITEVFSGTGYSCDRPHALYVYDYDCIRLWVYPQGDGLNKPRYCHIITANS